MAGSRMNDAMPAADADKDLHIPRTEGVKRALPLTLGLVSVQRLGGDASLAPAASRGTEIAGLVRLTLRASRAENRPVAAAARTNPATPIRV